MGVRKVLNLITKKVVDVAEMACPQSVSFTIQGVILQKLISTVVNLPLYVATHFVSFQYEALEVRILFSCFILHNLLNKFDILST